MNDDVRGSDVAKEIVRSQDSLHCITISSSGADLCLDTTDQVGEPIANRDAVLALRPVAGRYHQNWCVHRTGSCSLLCWLAWGMKHAQVHPFDLDWKKPAPSGEDMVMQLAMAWAAKNVS